MSQSELLIAAVSVLHEHAIEYMISGSIVSSLQGEPRATHDIDIVVNITPLSLRILREAFKAPRYYLSDIANGTSNPLGSMFNLIDSESGDKIDFWILSDEPYDQARFARKIEQTVFDIKMIVCAPEDTILMKLKWSELSGGSPKQFADALSVYEMQYANLNHEYLNAWSRTLGVNDDWQRLIKSAQPLT